LPGFRAPGAVVARLLAGGAHALAHRLDFFRRAVAQVGGAGVQHRLDDLAVAVHALHLVERAFVVLQAQPLHAVQDRLHRFRGRALQVGVFDAQDEGAAEVAGIGPRIQRGAGAAEVEKAGRAGSETGADGHGVM
jgi:hypothetical protein